MKKYKILIITKEAKGGNYTFLKQITKLEKKGFKIRHFFLKKDKLVKFKNHSVHSADNLYPKDNNPSTYKALLFIKNLYRARKVCKKENPDVLLTSDLYSFILLFLVRFFFNKEKTLIAFINNNLSKVIKEKPNYFFRYVLDNVFKIFINKIDLVIVPSQGLQSHIAHVYNARNIIVINHGIETKDISKFKVKKEHKNLKSNNKVKFLSIGRLENQKDFKTLLRAFSLVIKKNKNVELLIIGEGEQRYELEQFSDKLNIVDSVKFLGWKKNIFPYLKLSNIFVSSSKYEGFGFVILEAMAAKIPVIATNSPYGPSEILGGGKFGILIPVGDYKRMAMEMGNLLNDPVKQKKFAKIGYERAKDFDLDKILNRYKEILLNLMYEKKNKISNCN